MANPFVLRDCSLAVIATGETAASLQELRDVCRRVPVSSLYYHFWGGMLRSSFVDPEYHNDFAKWAHHALHDEILSERLGILDPVDFKDLEELRRTIIDILEERLYENEYTPLWTRRDDAFRFLRSVIVVYDTNVTLAHPSELKMQLPTFFPSSIFYHFIDARRRTKDKIDDFTHWLAGFKEEFADLTKKIGTIDPYFSSLSEIKTKLVDVINEYFK